MNNINLKIGDQGASVAQLQQMLAKLGYHTGEGSSVFDTITQRSLKAFQNDYGFKVTGMVDEIVWVELEKRTGKNKQPVKEEQEIIPLVENVVKNPFSMSIEAPAEKPKEIREEVSGKITEEAFDLKATKREQSVVIEKMHQEVHVEIPVIPAPVIYAPLDKGNERSYADAITFEKSNEHSYNAGVEILTAPVDRTPANWSVMNKRRRTQKSGNHIPVTQERRTSAIADVITPNETGGGIPIIESTSKGAFASRQHGMNVNKMPKKHLTCQEDRPVLKSGMGGAHVIELQKALNRLGFLGSAPDGSFGNFTVNAVRAFQRSVGLSANGTADGETWTAIDKALSRLNDDAAKETLRQGATGATVSALQLQLKTLGYYGGGVDGIFGVKTAAAVREFQRKHNLTTDGVVGPKTWAALEHVYPDAPSPVEKHSQTTLREGDRGEMVVKLQEDLRKLDFNPGPPDGIFGYGTKTAVEEFQTSRGLHSDGVADPVTIAMIDKAASEAAPLYREI